MGPGRRERWEVFLSAELDERSSQEGKTVAAMKVDRRHGRACAGKPVSSSHLACLKKKKK